MKQSLYTKLLTCYAAIGIICFFLVTAGGSILIERYLENSISEKLYIEACKIADNEVIKYNISSSNLESVREALSSMAGYQDSLIWILNNKGEVVVSTRKEISPDTPINIKKFDPISSKGTYYQIGNFFGYFNEDYLSVITPITADMTTKGYVCIHYLMSHMYQTRASLLTILQILSLVIYLSMFFLLLFYHKMVQKPLRQISLGASEYANGNLSYHIPVSSEDEMGYLANTLNYMAERLNRNGKYQRKFISDVSHDFRSPLTSIKGYIEAMLDGTIPPEMQEKYLKIISYESSRLEKLTRSLLTLNELDVQKRMMHIHSFDINEMIKKTAATFEGSCTKKKILLELILSGKELYVNADEEQIQQVLYNLLDNAIKFSDNNSSVIVETTEKNGKIFVSVKDHGCGIPKESLSKIWERFYKTDASRGKDRKGTGLGLAIVREIINAHDQNINLISTEGIGTEFIFTLEKTK